MNDEIYLFVEEFTEAIFYYKILPMLFMIGGFILLGIAVIIHYIKTKKKKRGRVITIMDETANFPKDDK